MKNVKIRSEKEKWCSFESPIFHYTFLALGCCLPLLPTPFPLLVLSMTFKETTESQSHQSIDHKTEWQASGHKGQPETASSIDQTARVPWEEGVSREDECKRVSTVGLFSKHLGKRRKTLCLRVWWAVWEFLVLFAKAINGETLNTFNVCVHTYCAYIYTWQWQSGSNCV